VVNAQKEAASHGVLEARARVARAKTEQDKIQLLLDRLVAEAKGVEARAARKLEDDQLAAQMAARGRHGSAKSRR
jgi:hypothetical protein